MREKGGREKEGKRKRKERGEIEGEGERTGREVGGKGEWSGEGERGRQIGRERERDGKRSWCTGIVRVRQRTSGVPPFFVLGKRSSEENLDFPSDLTKEG